MMRMVLVPAPIIYPHIPIAPVEPLLPVHPLPVAQTTSSNTDVPRSSTTTKNLESSTSVTQSWPASTTQICTASTSTTLPPIHTIKRPVYAPIATLDHTQTPPPTILITDTMDNNTRSQGMATPDDSFPASILITDVRSLVTPHTISNVDEHRNGNTPSIQHQESAPTSTTITQREEPCRTSSLGSSPAIVVHPQLQPTPSPEPEMNPRPASAASAGPAATSTTPLGRNLSPMVVLHRSPVLDAINDDRNFREIERKMEEIHSDS